MKFFKDVRSEFAKASKGTLTVYLVLRILVIVVLIRQAFLGNYDRVVLCLLTLLLFLLPYFINKRLKVELPSTLQIIVLIFVFSAEILGEIRSFYVNVPHFDTVLHTVTGFFAAAVGFALIDILNTDSHKLKLSPLYVSLVAFCFSMMIGGVWELFEYAADKILKTDMQKDNVVTLVSTVTLDPEQDNNTVVLENIGSTIINYEEDGKLKQTIINGGYLDIGINDTMKDLFVNFIGAVVFSIFGGLYVKNRDKYKFVEKITPRKAR